MYKILVSKHKSAFKSRGAQTFLPYRPFAPGSVRSSAPHFRLSDETEWDDGVCHTLTTHIPSLTGDRSVFSRSKNGSNNLLKFFFRFIFKFSNFNIQNLNYIFTDARTCPTQEGGGATEESSGRKESEGKNHKYSHFSRNVLQ